MKKFPTDHWSYPLIALLAGVVMVLRVVSTTWVFNNTIDEPYHIGAAMVLYEARQLVLGVQHPPLARWVIGLPLVMQGVKLPEARDEYVVAEYPAFGIGADLLVSKQLSYWRMLTAARHALLIFPVLALFYLYRLGRYLANPLAAMLATVFFSNDPTFLAHAGLVGTDTAACAGFLWGLYYGVRFIARPTTKRAIIAGAALALAVCCKFSCLLLLPSLALIAIARIALAGAPSAMFRRHPSIKRLALLAGVGFVVTWALYGFAINPMRQQALPMPEPFWSNLPAIIREQPIPMPSFWLGQAFLASRTAVANQPTYLNGNITMGGSLIYFLEALLLKSPIGFILALAGSVVILIFIQAPMRRLLRLSVLALPIALYMAISMRSRYQLGIRHLLPILPLMYLLAVCQFVRIGRVMVLLALIVLCWIEVAAMHPDYLSFFNVACGGPRAGERYLLDSNLDWGQDLARLAAWLKSPDAQGRPYSIRCAYTTKPLLAELGIDPQAQDTPPHGLFAVSKNIHHRFEWIKSADPDRAGELHLGEDYSWLSRYPVVKRIGYSIDVYDLDAEKTR